MKPRLYDVIEWRTYDDLVSRCRASLHRVRAFAPDIIVGIPRSGMLPASIIATSLNIPLADLHSFCAGVAWKWRNEVVTGGAFKHALIVDDASGYGKTMRHAIETMPTGVRVSSCAVYGTQEASKMLDLCFEVCPKPRKFEWNFWRDGYLGQTAVDIDGVLCVDPTREQRKNSVFYRHDAIPLYLPTKPVAAIITGRNEKWRSETEHWLIDHGVEYGKLYMSTGDYSHQEHKAMVYASIDAQLFVESETDQSEFINIKTGKPVLCSKNRRLYRNG